MRDRRLRIVPRPPLEIRCILAWADHEHDLTGLWPRTTDGAVRANLNEKWKNIDQALRQGGRGLPGGDSLPRLLARARGRRNPADLPPLTETQILAWADAWHDAKGEWPHTDCAEEVLGAPGECWRNIDQALRDGLRGLPGSDSLARLLARARGHRNTSGLPPLRVEQILTWARAHRRRHGRWPTALGSAIEDAPGECWRAVNSALRDGLRGLPGGDSLGLLLARRLGVRNRTSVPALSVPQILRWARDYRRRTGRWPNKNSGPIRGVRGETWMRVHTALLVGLRGLPAGSSLCRLLAEAPTEGRAEPGPQSAAQTTAG